MDWSRLAGTAFDTYLVVVALIAVLLPPDPFTQLLYGVPGFVAGLPVLYRYREPAGRWWKRYFVFVAGFVAVALAWRLLALTAGSSAAGVPPALLVAGVAVGAWLAYFGGLQRLRGARSR